MAKPKIIFVIVIFALLIFPALWLSSSSAQERLPVIDDNKVYPPNLKKPASLFDRGIGFMDAGEMQVNGVENFGVIGNQGLPYCKHGFWGEVRWIIPYLAVPPQPWATNILTEEGEVVDRSEYYNVIESITMHFGVGIQGWGYTDWEAQDYASTQLMGDETWGSVPLIATSTRPNSWPQGYFDNDRNSATYREFISTPGEYHWPGYWALDPDPESPTFGTPIEGKFVSDKDIFYVMNDKYNGIRYGDQVNVGYPIGFDMEVSGYCYSTRAYKDIVFFNYNLIYRDDITDPSRQYYSGTVDSLYFGFLIDPDLPGRDPWGNTGYEPGWAEDDYCVADTVRDIFVMFDKDAWCKDVDSPYSEGPVSAHAIAYLKTPKDIGLTSFHYFTQEDFDAEPGGQKMERIVYAMASGRKDILTTQDQQKYFHGEDPLFDDLTLLRDLQESQPPGSRPDPWFMMSSGPFSATPGDTIALHFCIVGGKDNPGALDADGFPLNPYEVRFADVLNNYDKAMELYSNSFQGTGPPLTPTLSAVGTKVLDENGVPVIYAEDGKITLYWDNVAEETVDILTKEKDFEGYKIYKAYFDRDADYVDWGQEIYEVTETGTVGDVLAYVPVFQCDLDNDYEGLDPYQSWFYLGDNTGVVHSWTDTDVTNGVRYRYCITAYDHPYTDRFFNANETSKGTSSKDLNVVDVIPGVRPSGFVPANIDTSFDRVSGVGNGVLQLEILDDNEVLGHNYTLSFSDSSGILEYSVFDEDDGSYKVTGYSNITDESSGDDPEAYPFFDGVGIKVINYDQPEYLPEESGWTTVTGAQASDYEIDVVPFTAIPSDYEIRFLGENADTNAVGAMTFPFQVWKVSVTPPQQMDILYTPPSGDYPSGGQIRIWEYLTPGSSTRTFTWVFSITWDPDTVVVGSDTTFVTEWGVGNAPAVGDVYTFRTKKPFSNDVFSFRTYTASSKTVSENELDDIKVVPNPYIVSSKTELYTGNSQWDLHDLRFTHLPPKCTISIFTLTGDLIREIHHDNPSYGEAHWDLLTEENLEISYGVYIYVVKTPEGKTKIGKLAVVK